MGVVHEAFVICCIDEDGGSSAEGGDVTEETPENKEGGLKLGKEPWRLAGSNPELQ